MLFLLNGHSLLLAETKYSNLCALCEHPEVCDYPDKYSGYDGALRCLSEHGGQVAWTKVYYVKKHFGVGNQHDHIWWLKDPFSGSMKTRHI